MAKKPKNNYTNPRTKKERSGAAMLLAIFALLFVWFLFWLYDWWDEFIGFPNSLKSKTKKAAAASINGYEEGGNSGNFSIIENTPIQYITNYQGGGHYEHAQLEAATIWIINHGAGVAPTIDLIDSDRNVINAHIHHTFTDEWNEEYEMWVKVCRQSEATFNTAESGWASVTF